MKIGIAQIKPVAGDIESNIQRHVDLIERAINTGSNLVYFPELSITGYEPNLAKDFISCDWNSKLAIFQSISNAHDVTIGVGAPLFTETGIQIGMYWFQKDKPKTTYAKQRLHNDELPYFVEATEQLILNVEGHKLAPAICYESLQPRHAEQAIDLGADIYLASVAKTSDGVDKAMQYFPELAKKYNMLITFSNCVSHCDNFLSVGKTSAWHPNGDLIAQLDDPSEGLIIVDSKSDDSETITL